MDSATVASPSSSDHRFWSALRSRVETILEERKPPCGGESEPGKQLRQDSLLLIRGLDSVASSLSQLTDVLGAAQQGVKDLCKPSMSKSLKRESHVVEDEENQPKTKRHCSSNDLPDKNEANRSIEPEVTGPDTLPDSNGRGGSDGKEDRKISVDVIQNWNMKKARNLAISMASKAASLARELTAMKSELCFTQERCTLLEEENRRLRDGLEKGVRPEEDDLVRLQLEALLAEKSRLANENANLTRENECLHQLVEYHQLTSQDLSPSYKQAMQETFLDFSSPICQSDGFDDENSVGDSEVFCTPSTNQFGFSSSNDEQCEEHVE